MEVYGFILQNRPYLSRKLQLVRRRCLPTLGGQTSLGGPSSTYQWNMNLHHTQPNTQDCLPQRLNHHGSYAT